MLQPFSGAYFPCPLKMARFGEGGFNVYNKEKVHRCAEPYFLLNSVLAEGYLKNAKIAL